MDLPEPYEKNSDDEANRCEGEDMMDRCYCNSHGEDDCECGYYIYQRGLSEGRKRGLEEAVRIVKEAAKSSWFTDTMAIEAIESAMKEDK